MRNLRRPPEVEVFGVSCDGAQLICHGNVGAVAVRSPAAVHHPVSVSGFPVRRFRRQRQLAEPATFGVADFAGLAPGTEFEVLAGTRIVGRLRTLETPRGPRLGTVATISDLHVGQRHYSNFPRVQALAATGPVDHRVGAAMTCLAAAVDEINAWAPDLVIVKGDIAHGNTAEEYDLAFAEISRLAAPVIVIPGNHDGGDYVGDDLAAAAAAHGLDADPLAVHELANWRIVTASTVAAGHQRGVIGPVADGIVEAIADATGPCLLAVHHQFQWAPLPHYVPTGIPWPSSRRLGDRLHAANPRVLVTSGHTHRNRVHHRRGLIATEVGSTKDFPGVWAGYELYADGFVQTVRRISRPDAFGWAERTRHAAFGAWQHWAAGSLADRCISHSWS